MADERYQWLDQEAAERLLRGEPVVPADDASRAQAELLARVLGAARTPAAVIGPDGELPGEAAALAAFRKASAERAAEAAAPGYAAPGHAAPELGTVRIASAPAGHRWGRSLRYGLAAAIAAVTVGGVAVAAGTGMLPITGEPGPARSVTAAETPGTPDSTVSGSPTAGTGTTDPAVPKDRNGGTPSPGSTDGSATTGAGPGGHGGVTPSPGQSTSGNGGGTEVDRQTALQACQDFQQGKLAESGRQQLQRALRNGETVKHYCARVLSGTPTPSTGATNTGRSPSGDAGRTGGSGTNSGSESGGSDGDDKGDRGGDKHRQDAPADKPGSGGPGKGTGKGAGKDPAKGPGKTGQDRSHR